MASKTWTFTLEFDEDIREPIEGQRATRSVGTRRVRCQVEISLDLETVANRMGRKAATSKSGRCVDGLLSVRRIGQVQEVSRQMKPAT